jgi:hypothetical protein
VARRAAAFVEDAGLLAAGVGEGKRLIASCPAKSPAQGRNSPETNEILAKPYFRCANPWIDLESRAGILPVTRMMSMARIDVSFLLLAALCLLVGLALGIGMGIAHNFQLAPVHAHLNLVGFVLPSIFGLTYRAYPMLARSRLALPHLALSGVGAVVLPFGIHIAVTQSFPAIAIAGAFIVFGGVAAFFANLVVNLAVAPSRAPLMGRRELARSAEASRKPQPAM